ncbi:MAG: transglycosylase domain-containing protein, partial [Patescibacteria group bacterium]
MQINYSYDRPSENKHKEIRPVPKKKHRFLDFFKTKKGRSLLIKRLILIGVTTILVGAIGFFAMAAWISRDLPDPNKLIDRSIQLSTKIYDRTGTHVLYEVHGDQQRTLITIEQIPDTVKNASITAEDQNFYTHKGFDLKGIARSVLANIFRGSKAQGGSTITQQLVKNAILTTEKTYTRKIKELVL